MRPLWLSRTSGSNEVIIAGIGFIFRNLTNDFLRAEKGYGRRERMKAKWMASGWIAAGVWLAGALVP